MNRLLLALLFLALLPLPASAAPDAGDFAKKEFLSFASRIPGAPLYSLAVQHNGRIKPLDTLSRENLVCF